MVGRRPWGHSRTATFPFVAAGGHGTKAVVAALLANAGIAVAEFVGFLLTSSGAMPADIVRTAVPSAEPDSARFAGSAAADASPGPR